MTNNNNRETLVRKYFIITPEQPTKTPVPKYGLNPFIAIAVLALCVILLLSGSYTLMGYLLVLIGIGLVGAVMTLMDFSSQYASRKHHERTYQQQIDKYRGEYSKAEPKPSDAQMDTWLDEDIEELKREAVEKMDLNEEDLLHAVKISPKGEANGEKMDLNEEDSLSPNGPDMPLVVRGPGKNAQVAVGKDGLIRFSIYDILLVYLTNYHLAAYKCTLDFATKRRLSESTQEYHYTDVVSVSTRTTNEFTLTVNDEIVGLGNSQQFALSVASGESISVATPISFREVRNVREEIKEGRLLDSGSDKAIRAIRSRLREKKGGAVG